jgi:hypothetical protein
MTGGTAKWSLASNVRQHAEVRSIIEDEIKKRQNPVRAELIDLIKKDPSDIQQEYLKTLKANKGNWNK